MQHIRTVALTGHIEYSWCVDVLKASFVRVQRGSSQLSISLESGDGQQWKTLLWHKAAPGLSRTLPIARPLQAKRAGADSWVHVLWLEWSGPLYFPSHCLDWRPTVVREGRQLRRDSGLLTVLSRCDNKFIPVECSENPFLCLHCAMLSFCIKGSLWYGTSNEIQSQCTFTLEKNQLNFILSFVRQTCCLKQLQLCVSVSSMFVPAP